MIRYGKQHIDHQDQKAVLETLKSELITQGPKIELFEKLLKSKFGSKYCSAVSSGTAALHLTGLALGWKKNDIILCSPISFLLHLTQLFIVELNLNSLILILKTIILILTN